LLSLLETTQLGHIQCFWKIISGTWEKSKNRFGINTPQFARKNKNTKSCWAVFASEYVQQLFSQNNKFSDSFSSKMELLLNNKKIQ
jgi:hypothetical protein